jgi:hypothetical protein
MPEGTLRLLVYGSFTCVRVSCIRTPRIFLSHVFCNRPAPSAGARIRSASFSADHDDRRMFPADQIRPPLGTRRRDCAGAFSFVGRGRNRSSNAGVVQEANRSAAARLIPNAYRQIHILANIDSRRPRRTGLASGDRNQLWPPKTCRFLPRICNQPHDGRRL